jgi:hypothetical protein
MTSGNECIIGYLVNFQAAGVTVSQIFDNVFV